MRNFVYSPQTKAHIYLQQRQPGIGLYELFMRTFVAAKYNDNILLKMKSFTS